MKNVPLYTDLAFCLILLPLMIYAFPVERWWGTYPLFFGSFVGWLYISLRAVEEQLPEGEFVRIHRSYLVPRVRITGFSRSEVTLGRNGKTLPIGKTYLDDVIPLLEE